MSKSKTASCLVAKETCEEIVKSASFAKDCASVIVEKFFGEYGPPKDGEHFHALARIESRVWDTVSTSTIENYLLHGDENETKDILISLLAVRMHWASRECLETDSGITAMVAYCHCSEDMTPVEIDEPDRGPSN